MESANSIFETIFLVQIASMLENSDNGYFYTHLPDGRSYPIFYHKSITVDDTEKLCYPKGRTFIGGQSIASTFLCSSAVCLLIG